MEKHHFEQAKLWIQAAEYIANEGMSESDKYAVAVAMLIHAIIKGNDSLTYKFMNLTARRHDDARRLFEELVKKGLVPAQYADYAQIIQEAINLKAKAEYRGGYFSKNEYDSLERKAKKFISLVEKIL